MCLNLTLLLSQCNSLLSTDQKKSAALLPFCGLSVFYITTLSSILLILAPDVHPSATISRNTSASFEIQITKPPKHLVNGILRSIVVKYNKSLVACNRTLASDMPTGEYVNYTVVVNHTEFFNSEGPFGFLLKNLSAHTIYDLQFSYMTVDFGNYSESIFKRTMEDGMFFLPTMLLYFFVLQHIYVLKKLWKSYIYSSFA